MNYKKACKTACKSARALVTSPFLPPERYDSPKITKNDGWKYFEWEAREAYRKYLEYRYGDYTVDPDDSTWVLAHAVIKIEKNLNRRLDRIESKLDSLIRETSD